MVQGWKVHGKRIAIGDLAGFATALLKYLSHDHPNIMALIPTEERSQIPWLFVGYAMGAIGLVLAGSIAAWISAEDSNVKLFFIGLSAPSFFAAGIPPREAVVLAPSEVRSPGPAPRLSPRIRGESSPEITFVSEAQAQDQEACISGVLIWKGFQVFLGIPEKYRVIVGSYPTRRQAAVKAKSVNDEDPTINATAGLRRCGSPFYPVVIGEGLKFREAEKLLEKAKKLESVADEAYLSRGGQF